MSQAINKEDIVKGQPFTEIAQDMEVALTAINKFDAKIIQLATHLQKDLSGALNTNLQGIEKVDKAMIESERLLQAKLKTQQAEIKLQEQQRKATEAQERSQEKANKTTERAVKLAQDEANAYKKLSKATADLKNESKRLGAEMLNLEQNGKKNTEQYRKLAIQYNATTQAAKQGDSQLKKLDERVGDNQRKVGSYTEAVRKLRNALGTLGLAFGGAQIVSFFTGNEIQLQRLQLALQNVMGTTDKYNQSFAYLTNLSKVYGQDLLVLTDTYKGFIAASKSSNLSLFELNKIYESVIKAGSSLALSNDEIKGSLLAIQQMFSKGTVSAEELRGQLGERLPGAFGIMARSMGVTEQELGKLMQAGNVMTKDVLPGFAIELEKTVGANAQKNINTIGGSWNVLKTNLMLYVNEGNNANGVTSKIASGFMFLAKNLGTIVAVGSKAIKWFLVYKASSIAITKYNDLMRLGIDGIAKSFLRSIPGTRAYTLAQIQASRAAQQAGVSASRAGKLINAIPWALIVTALFELGSALWEIASGAKQAEEDMARLNATTEDATKSLDKNINKILEKQRLRNKEIQDQLTAKNITQEQFIKLQKESSELTIKELRTNKNKVISRKNEYIQDLLFIKAENKKILNTTNIDVAEARTKLAESIAKKYNIKANKDVLGYDLPFIPEDVMGQLEANIKGASIKIKGYTSAINENKEAIETNKAELIGLSKEDKAKVKTQHEINTEFKQTNEYLSEQIRLLNEIKQIENERILDQMDKNIDEMLRLANQSTAETGIIESDLLEEMINDRFELEKEFERKKLELQIQTIIDTYKREKIIRQQKLDEERDQLIKNAKGDKTAIDKINANYKVENEKLRLEENERVKDLETQKVLLTKTLKDLIVQIEKDKNQEINNVNDTLIDTQIEFYKTKNDIAKDNREKENEEAEKQAKTKVEREAEQLEVFQQIQEAITDFLKEQIDKRIALLQKESDFAKTQQDQLQELAAQGNIFAQQSIAEKIQIQRDAQEEQMRLEKQKQNLEMISTGLKTFEGEISKGKSPAEALATTLVTTKTLVQLLSNLNFFEKGTENAPEGFAVTDEKGAELHLDKSGKIKDFGSSKGAQMKYLERGDKIINAQNTAKIFSEISNANKIAKVQDVAGNSYDLIPLLSEIKGMRTDIKNNATQIKVHWDTMGNIIEQVNKGGNQITNRYRVK